MTVALDTLADGTANASPRSRAKWLLTTGFFVYTLLILAGHIMGFAPAYAYLHTVCPDGCALTPANAQALARNSLSIAFSVNLYIIIQVLYILVSAGIALLIVLKKPGQWVPLGLSCFLVALSAYEGADYPALATAYPVLDLPSRLLIYLGMGILGMYALLTFPNGKFGSRLVLAYFGFQAIEGLLAILIASPIVRMFDDVFGLLTFPIILFILIYRYRRLLNAREQAAIKWLILSFSVFILLIILALLVLPAIAPEDSLIFLALNLVGFFGCGINIAGFLMAVLYANAFDIDIFVRRTLLYTLLTAILALLYAALVLGSQFVLALFSAQLSGFPIVLVGSTLVVAALFQPLRHRLQQTIDRRFYRQKYDASRIIEQFSANLRSEIDLGELSERLVMVVHDTMQPAHVSLWLRQRARTEKSSPL